MLRRSRPLGGLLLVALLVAELALPGSTFPARAATLPTSIRFVPVVSGLSSPTFVTNAGDGSNRLFILQQPGQIRIFKNGSLLSTPFLNIAGLPGFTGLNGEQGLLGLAFDPHYTSNGFFYITYTTTHADPVFLYTTTLARYRVSVSNPDVADPSTASVLLSIPKKYTNHNGGMLAFGPDGYLYVSMGDGGSGGDPDNNAQNLHTLLGKILRLDVTSTPAPGQKYVIPPTNPFFSSTDPAVKKEIWAYGLRNPWRYSFDRSTGDLFIADVGQNTEEEVDFQAASSAGGQNYGWHILEGNLCYDPSSDCVPPPGYVAPVATYDHGVNDSFGCSISGGYVYRGSASPTLEGVYFYGDFCSGKVLGLVRNPDSSWSSAVLASSGFSISTFGQDEQGEIYVADYSGGVIYRISAATVSISGSVGVNGISLSYTDGTPRTVLSAANGSYTITVPYSWSGTVTPSNSCLTFNPLSLTYSNIINNQLAQNYTPSLIPAASCTLLGVSIAGNALGSYVVPPSGHAVAAFPSVNNGPVKVFSLDGVTPVVASERALFSVNGVPESFTEMMGLPNNQLDTTYWMPWYNNVDLDTQLRFGNVSGSTATVHVYIGGVEMTSGCSPSNSPYTLAPGNSIRVSCAGENNGPVQIVSNVKIVAAERVIYVVNGMPTSFTEMMGVPNSQLDKTYWMPWYNNVDLASQLRFGNVSGSTATVHVYIGGQEMIPPLGNSPYTLQPGASTRVDFPGINNGPVQIVSNVKIVAAERVIYVVNGMPTSFTEMMGVPNSQLDKTYWMPWYNNVDLASQLRFGNVSGSTATVHVYIGGQEMIPPLGNSPYTLQPGASTRVDFPGINGGPVQIVSDQPIVAAERVIYPVNGIPVSFSEMMGLPSAKLDSTYWMPWYNNVALDTQLRFGVP